MKRRPFEYLLVAALTGLVASGVMHLILDGMVGTLPWEGAVLITASSMASAWLLRPLIRLRLPFGSVNVGVLYLLLAAALAGVVGGLAFSLMEGHGVADVIAGPFVGAGIAIVVSILHSYLLVPLAIVGVLFLSLVSDSPPPVESGAE